MKKLILFVCITFFSVALSAQGGMWIPLLLSDVNEGEMQSLGMKMTAQDIYDVNNSSLKDAIVHFGGFCTGEVISSQGLVLTNHHCGFSAIQTHSSLENNYLQDGFWAKELKDELPNEGLFVTFIVRIEDVTKAVLADVTDNISETERQSLIDSNMDKIKKGTTLTAFEDVSIKPFYKGNQYFLFVTENYNDIRLVGAPPSSIGKYGADTDNWVWPRHTGDFSMFRIYAGKDNKPADYSPDNVPYKPKHHLPVSLDGVAEDDFTLVFGFPGRTDEYLTASGVDLRINKLNPIRISIRDESLAVIDKAMRSDPKARIQYASKQSRISNGWKKWIGEIQGIEASHALEKKRSYEAEFKERIRNNKGWTKEYGKIIATLDQLYADIEPYAKSKNYVSEIIWRNIEVFYIAGVLDRYEKMYQNGGLSSAIQARLPRVISFLEGYYKDFVPAVDQEIFTRLIKIYIEKIPKAHQAHYVKDQVDFAGGDIKMLADKLYTQSFLTKGDVVLKMLQTNPDKFFKSLGGDYVFQMRRAIQKAAHTKVSPSYTKYDDQIQLLKRKYMKAQMDVFPKKSFFPDANSTLRVTYGQVKGYAPRDAVKYERITWLDGVMEKYKPGDYEFDLPEKLVQLYKDKDYGQYAENGKVPVCFIGTNHTSGGNSGSPAIDANGNLIGLNFDRVWEGTMSDVNYDPEICRNIMVDIRYVLFIVDKFAGAKRLIDEMDLVHPKK